MEEWLKQRLVGASVLVLLAVIFIPVLLEYSYEPGEVGIDPPPVPAGAEDDEFSSRVLALDESPSPLPASRAAPAGAGSRDEGDPGAMAMDGGRAVDEEPGSPAAVAALSPSVESPEPTPTDPDPDPDPSRGGRGEGGRFRSAAAAERGARDGGAGRRGVSAGRGVGGTARQFRGPPQRHRAPEPAAGRGLPRIHDLHKHRRGQGDAGAGGPGADPGRHGVDHRVSPARDWTRRLRGALPAGLRSFRRRRW